MLLEVEPAGARLNVGSHVPTVLVTVAAPQNGDVEDMGPWGGLQRS